MTTKDKKVAYKIYLYLGALFITSLVVSNLIFQKFFYWRPFGDVTVFGASLFEISVGILPYPITFLITDLISEIYGKKKGKSNCYCRNLCLLFFYGDHFTGRNGTGYTDLAYWR